MMGDGMHGWLLVNGTKINRDYPHFSMESKRYILQFSIYSYMYELVCAWRQNEEPNHRISRGGGDARCPLLPIPVISFAFAAQCRASVCVLHQLIRAV